MSLHSSHQSTAQQLNSSGFISVFTAAPHRMMFLGGGIQFIAMMLWWLIELTGRYVAIWPPLVTTIPAVYAHVYLAFYGLFPFFIFGFLMTTFPRWMPGGMIDRRSYAGCFAFMMSGIGLFYIGLFAHKAILLAGIVLLCFGWLTCMYALFRVFAKADAPDKTYETILYIALFNGLAGSLCFLFGFLFASTFLLRISWLAGIWLFLAPILFTVAHRMIPFFSNIVIENYRVYRPRWSLLTGLALMLGHFGMEISGWNRWLVIVDLPLALIAFHYSRAWALLRSLSVRLLAMLHIAFFWLGIGATMFSIQSLALVLAGQDILGRAPIHALGIGFIASMAVAFASRVSLGHSGRPLIADRLTWWCFIAVQAAAVLRVCADLPRIPPVAHDGLQLLASGIWVIGLTVWGIRYLPIYLRPRLDGNPG